MPDRRGKLSRHMWIRTVLGSIALAGGIATVARAQVESQMDYIQEENASTYEAPWQEAEVKFPPPPARDSLVALDGEGIISNYEYFVDPASITLGNDQVMRYVVVLESDTGGSATYYEGMRCDTREAKSYGYVTRQGAFKPLASSRWMRLRTSGPYVYRYVLASLYMCDRDGWPIAEKQVRERLVQNASGVRLRPKPANTGK